MNGLTLSFENMETAVRRMKDFMSVEDFCLKFNLDYEEFHFYEIVPVEIKKLILNGKIHFEVGRFLTMETNFSLKKKIQILTFYIRKRTKFDNIFEKLFWVMYNYENFVKQDVENERKSTIRWRKKVNEWRIKDGLKPISDQEFKEGDDAREKWEKKMFWRIGNGSE